MIDTMTIKMKFSVGKLIEKPALIFKGRFFLGFICILIMEAGTPLKAQSELFKSLQESYDLNVELYFYASTLRMINLSRDPNFDEMVKDIEKMIFYQINDVPTNEIRAISKRFIEMEEFEELMSVEGKDETFYVLGKNENEYVALLKADKDLVAINLKGMIRIHKIPDLINSLIKVLSLTLRRLVKMTTRKIFWS